MSTATVETPKTETKPVAAKAPALPRFCLSGSGKTVKGKNSVFAMGGDSTLKSRILRGDIDGTASGLKPLTKEALDHARHAWPDMFGKDGNPKPPVAKVKKEKPVKVESKETPKDVTATAKAS